MPRLEYRSQNNESSLTPGITRRDELAYLRLLQNHPRLRRAIIEPGSEKP